MFCFVIFWLRTVLNNPIRVCVMHVNSKYIEIIFISIFFTLCMEKNNMSHLKINPDNSVFTFLILLLLYGISCFTCMTVYWILNVFLFFCVTKQYITMKWFNRIFNLFKKLAKSDNWASADSSILRNIIYCNNFTQVITHALRDK